MNNTKWLYIYVAILFILTFLFANRLISGFKTQTFDYFRLSVNLILLIYIVIKIKKLGKIENDKLK